jgi:hypothetical protein
VGQILQLIHGLATLAATRGFYLQRWIQVINAMIYKKPGVIELDKLCVIHLFEADFNLLVGVYFGRQAMHHQVDRNLIHQGQFGKPGGECHDAALSKVLHNLMAFFTQTPMGQFESNATACFDREVMNFVFTCFYSHGAPMGPLRMWEQVLYHVVHRVKTSHGLSTATYTFSEESPIHGPGQGSRGGPASCSTMTSLLIEGMYRLCHRLTFSDPSQAHQYSTTTNMFIDDASNCTNASLSWLYYPPELAEVVSMLQQESQTWERLLWTSGGLLNLTKFLYYVTELYESAPFMLASDRDIFEIPIKQRQLQSKSTLRAFYIWAQPVVNVIIAKALEMGDHFRTIDQYFCPPIPPAIFDIIL